MAKIPVRRAFLEVGVCIDTGEEKRREAQKREYKITRTQRKENRKRIAKISQR